MAQRDAEGGMKYLVTLKRKQTTNAAQNSRQVRIEVIAKNGEEAQQRALAENGNWKYFTVANWRAA